jgi:hypothetical protein
MAYKLSSLYIKARNGGFIVGAELESDNVDANPNDNKYDEYVVSSYAKLMKAIKDELKDYKPVRKPRAKKEVA